MEDMANTASTFLKIRLKIADLLKAIGTF